MLFTKLHFTKPSAIFSKLLFTNLQFPKLRFTNLLSAGHRAYIKWLEVVWLVLTVGGSLHIRTIVWFVPAGRHNLGWHILHAQRAAFQNPSSAYFIRTNVLFASFWHLVLLYRRSAIAPCIFVGFILAFLGFLCCAILVMGVVDVLGLLVETVLLSPGLQMT